MLHAPGFWEWMFLGLLALLIFGPERLPKMAQSAGEMIARFKREAAGTLDELKAAAELDEFSGVARELRETSDDVRGTFAAATTGDTRQPKDRSAVMAGALPSTPPPFDPDTP